MDNLGISFKDNAQAIDARTQALSQMSGFDDELVTTTFTNLVRRTGDVTKAMRLNAIAVDVARGRNISLESASSLVTRASLGMAGALRRVGIAAREGASATELLELLQRKYAGSAERYGQTAAGAQQRFQVALENTQEVIGTAVLPALTGLLDKATDYLNNQENQKRIQDFVNDSVEKGTELAHDAASAYDFTRDAIVGTHDALKDLGTTISGGGNLGPEIRAVIALKKFYDDLAISIKNVATNTAAIEAARQGERFERIVTLPRVTGQRAFVGRPLTAAQLRQEALARTGGTGTDEEIAAITGELGFDRKALAFAKQRIAEGRGNLKVIEDQVIRLQGEIRSAIDRTQGIREERRQAAEEARRKAEQDRLDTIEALIPDQLSGRGSDLGAFAKLQTAAARAIGGSLGKFQGKPALDTLKGLLGQASTEASLRTQIAEQSARNETDLVPFLEKERQAAQRQLKLLRSIGATNEDKLRAQLDIAQINKRIRDIRNQDNKGFSLTEFFAEAAKEQALYGSNISGNPDDLSGQGARASVSAIAQAPRNAAKAALAGAQIVQNFWGDMPNPAQALQQASQAARALRY